MAGLLKNLFKNDAIPENLSQELRSILSEMESERKAFELLTIRAEGSAESFEKLATPVAVMEKTVGELSVKVNAFENLTPQIAAIQEQAVTLSEAHRRAESKVGEVVGDVERAGAELQDLRQRLDAALGLKEDLTGFLELEGPFKTLRTDVDGLAGEVREFGDRFARVREEHEGVLRGYSVASGRLDEFETQYRELRGGVGDAEQRVDKLEHVMQHVEQICAEIPNTKQELGTLKALGDYVTQKVSALEQQRDAVDRATAQAAHLSEMMRQIDQETQQQKENSKFLSRLRVDVEALKSLHIKLSEQSKEIATRQQQIEEEDHARNEELTALRAEMYEDVQKAVKRLKFESGGLDSVSERVVTLRTALSDFESRYESLDESKQVITDIHTQVEDVSSRVTVLAAELADIESQADKVKELPANVERIDRLISDVTERIGGIERPAVLTAVEEAEQRIGDVEVAVKSLEVRSDNIEGLADRMRRVGEELDRRNGVIEKASERLNDVSSLRQEAAAAARALEDQTTKLTAQLTTAGSRTKKLTELVDRVEERSNELRFAEKRMSRFEEWIANWKLAEAKLTEGMKRVSERQSSVDAIQSEIKRLFEITENTVEDVRKIADARQEIADQRPVLDEILGELDEVTERADALEGRKRQVDQAEERLARAGALLIDIKSTLESVNGQKAFLDEVVDKAGSLTFQAKQAEALIATLREERDLTNRFRAAVEEKEQEVHAKAG